MAGIVRTGIVVLDVDGVIYREFYLTRIAHSKGFAIFLKVLSLGVRYYRGKITVRELLRKGYGAVQNLGTREAQEIAREIKKVTNIKKTISILHAHGYLVALVSTGIPDFILENLREEIGADYSRGMHIEIKDGVLDSNSIRTFSKVDVVERLIRSLDLRWDQVVSVGDDPNNIELFDKSGRSVGFNPSRSVRKHADVVIEGNDLIEIVPHIIKNERLPRKLRADWFYWRREYLRKGIHMLGAALPFAARYNKPITVYFLAALVVLYFFSELLRFRGIRFVPLGILTQRAKRTAEKEGLIYGPILLGLGILIVLVFFDFPVYLPAILTASVSDTLSAVVGKRFGKTRILGMHNRTLEGSAAFFGSSLAILLLTTPPAMAVTAAVLGTLIELFARYNLDNLLVPVGLALFLSVA
jgi:dolichol kinase/phosphoserine phosphatase